ncbi:hypothetical protein Q5P01_007045 [Channa striata]|uniref:CCHC-type domain-containing protein n=1 Tax=Channa striata TaxID=64152 RepID=A0AA88N2X1_CHASR|nr:hypothetical protein Q5P01_007045 [Channa striata]
MDPAESQRAQGAWQPHEAQFGQTQQRVEENSRRLDSLCSRFEQALALSSFASSSDCKIAPPERFSGEPDKYRTFVSSLSLFFELQPSTYSTGRSKVAYAISLLSGKAHEWGMAEWDNRSECCRSYEAFSEELSFVFNPSASRRASSSRLFKLTQSSSSVTEYTVEFRTLAASANWREETLFDKYYEGLSSRIKDEMAARTLPSSLRSLIELAVAIDQRLQERQTERQAERQAEHQTDRRVERLSERRPAILPADPTSPVHRPTDQHPSGQEEPMQVGRVKLSVAERQCRIVEGLCLYCGESGHRVRLCPLNDKACQSTGRR